VKQRILTAYKKTKNKFNISQEKYLTLYSRRQRRILQFPILLVIIYLAFTLVLYALGPFAWVTYKPVSFWTLQVSYIGMLYLGYQFGLRWSEKEQTEWQTNEDCALIKWMNLLVWFNLIFVIVNLFRGYCYNSFDFPGLINNITYGIQHMGNSYSIYQSRISTIPSNQILGGQAVTFVNYIWEFIAFDILLLGILYIKKVSKPTCVCLLITYFVIIIYFISIGTNIGVFRIILAVVLFYILKQENKHFYIDKGTSKKGILTIIVLVFLAISIVIVYFVTTMKSRGGILQWNSDSYNVGGIPLNRDSIFFKLLPSSLYIPLISLSRYLTSGYYGFSLCLRLPWIPTFGLGSSLQLVDIISEHFFDVRTRTYQYRAMQFGWDDRIQWHSMYSWIANDFSFIGVIFILFIFGFVFALAYKDSLTKKNPFAKVIVYYFIFAAIFIPCNNQIIQTTYVLFSFITMFVCWILTRNGHLLPFRREIKNVFRRKPKQK
jgi:hypothetical protein